MPDQQPTTIESRLRALIVDQVGIGPEEVKLESSFMDDLGFDSLEAIELVVAVEDEFNAELTALEDGMIPEGHEDQIRTFGDAVAYIESGGTKLPSPA